MTIYSCLQKLKYYTLNATNFKDVKKELVNRISSATETEIANYKILKESDNTIKLIYNNLLLCSIVFQIVEDNRFAIMELN